MKLFCIPFRKGNIFSGKHLINNPAILVQLFIFQSDKSGNDYNKKQLSNNIIILITSFIFHFDKLDNDTKINNY